MTEPGPIFVGGLERTGTSLLYALLASHPRIAMSRRTNWWNFFSGQYGDLAEPRNLDRILAAMMSYRRHRKLEPDPERLRREFLAGEPTYCRLFALLQAQHAERLGKPRWGDKSLHTERHAATVYECFPEATILHMVRDPRDRYASSLKRWRSNRGGVGAATAAWIGSVELGLRNEARYPGRYRIVRYETLAAEPERTMREICELIGEPYDPAILEMRGAADFREAGGNSSYGRFAAGQISTASIGRFRTVLRPAQIAFVDARAGSLMDRVGYATDAPALAGGDRLRYLALDVPLNLARMAAWRGREAYYNLTGRSPSAHTLVAERLEIDQASKR